MTCGINESNPPSENQNRLKDRANSPIKRPWLIKPIAAPIIKTTIKIKPLMINPNRSCKYPKRGLDNPIHNANTVKRMLSCLLVYP